MAVYRYVVPEAIPEKTSWDYECELLDTKSGPIPLASISTLTLSLYNLDQNKTVINSINLTDIKNDAGGRGTIGVSDGKLTIHFFPDDMQIIDGAVLEEVHVALIKCTYGPLGIDAWNHEIEHKIKNLEKVS